MLNSSGFRSLQLTFLRTLFGFINEVFTGMPFYSSLASWALVFILCEGWGLEGCRKGGGCIERNWCVWTLPLISQRMSVKLTLVFLLYKMEGNAYCAENHIDESYQYFKWWMLGLKALGE